MTQTVPYSTNGRTRVWTYTYDATGLMTSIDGPRTDVSDVTSFAYTGGNLTSITNALSQVTQITAYNGRGLPTTIVDPNSVTTNLGYDVHGRLTSHAVVDASGDATTSIAYDAAGLVTRITRPNGAYLDFTYDQAQRLTGIANNLGETVTYTLDALGNRTLTEVRDGSSNLVRSRSAVFDTLGRLLQSIGAAGQTTVYAYDHNSNNTAVTDPLTRQTAQAYDALNRLATVTDALSGVASNAYDARDNITGVTDQRSLATAYIYDGLNNLLQVTSPDTGATVYEYDAAGNRTKATDARGVVTEYSYDALNRLTAKSFPATPAENVTYSYDAIVGGNKGVGRLTGISDPSGSTALTYDHRGNVTQDARTIGGHPDHRSTTLRITDGSQALKWDAILTPFGETHSLPAQALTYSPRLPGQFIDSEANTGWHQNWFRTYDPSLGRYAQSDPIGIRGGLNTFGYVNANPVGYVDPEGLNPAATTVEGGVIGFALGGPPGAVAGAILGFALGVGIVVAVKEICIPSNNVLNEKADAERDKSRKKGIPDSEIGPSGKPKIHVKKHATKKRAEDAAAEEGQGPPMQHPSPTKGGPHYHPTDAEGGKVVGGAHHEYPK